MTSTATAAVVFSAMRYVLIALLLAVDLGRGFQEPEIALESDTSSSITYNVSVEVAGLPEAVVVHFIDPGDDQVTSALAPRGNGRYGGIVEVERANLIVVFESISAGDSILSTPADLLELGVAPATLGIQDVEAEEPEEDDRNWLWLVLAGGATVLSLLAFWALGDFRRSERASAGDGEASGDDGAAGDAEAAEEEAHPAS